jgi:hypothetical protein
LNHFLRKADFSVTLSQLPKFNFILHFDSHLML